MSSDIAVSVTGLSKTYQVYPDPVDRLKQATLSWLWKRLGGRNPDYFTEFRALRPISFDVRRGETLGIVGRNGSGKSTLLQLICGTLTSSSGHCSISGRIAALLELGSGFNPEFTGRENVELYGAILGLSTNEMQVRFDDILRFADIGDYIDQPVKTYSSGMTLRLAFSVAIHVDPDVLVVDEALAVGDERFQRKCFAKIEDVKNAGTTILFVSHSGGTVVELCDRVLLLDKGELLLQGDPKFVMERYQKLIYAPDEEAEGIRAEIMSLNDGQSNVLEKFAAEQVDEIEVSAPETVSEFDPNLVPLSSVSYSENGARITGARIVKNGRAVNLLTGRERYKYQYTVEILSRACRLRFGMMIKNIAGTEFGGYATPLHIWSTPEAPLNPGQICEVTIEFECNLAEGTYFVNAGVLGDLGGGETYLHRLFDAAMFKVTRPANQEMTGAVDFKCEPIVLVAD